jgi:hypothetical protein
LFQSPSRRGGNYFRFALGVLRGQFKVSVPF